MAWGKTAEEKAEIQKQREAEEHARTPLGQAEAAKAEDAEFFQIELEISQVGGGASAGRSYGQSSAFGMSSNTVKRTGGRPDILGQIESLGWKLEHVGYVFIETGATTSNRMGGTGQGVVTRGQVMGIYLFRAVR